MHAKTLDFDQIMHNINAGLKIVGGVRRSKEPVEMKMFAGYFSFRGKRREWMLVAIFHVDKLGNGKLHVIDEFVDEWFAKKIARQFA